MVRLVRWKGLGDGGENSSKVPGRSRAFGASAAMGCSPPSSPMVLEAEFVNRRRALARAPLRRVFLRVFSVGLATNAALTRSPFRLLEQRVLTPLFVMFTKWVRGSKPVEPTAAALGSEWERLLASKKTAHVTSLAPATATTPETAYGEISVQCPLRGTGDVHACHRLMAYDRALVEAAGGQFVVLDSQATPGRTSCRIAIRKKGDAVGDLVPAHDPSRRGQG